MTNRELAERWRRRAAGLEEVARLQRAAPVEPARNRRIFGALWNQARTLGDWPPGDPLQGIEREIDWVRIVRRVRPTP